ncbi:PREDICTED: translation initiation factor IF-2-like, partial [Chinchilla lanigera]|uniref:translation initiation factor IF-2-like n=1 Tax=Chinchilla lanigera TaxID=34839 RepID=UPI000696A03F
APGLLPRVGLRPGPGRPCAAGRSPEARSSAASGPEHPAGPGSACTRRERPRLPGLSAPPQARSDPGRDLLRLQLTPAAPRPSMASGRAPETRRGRDPEPGLSGLGLILRSSCFGLPECWDYKAFDSKHSLLLVVYSQGSDDVRDQQSWAVFILFVVTHFLRGRH